MKRIAVCVILVFSVLGLTFAQTSPEDVQQPPCPQELIYNNIAPGPSKVIINGVLGVSRGMITLTDKNGVAWYILGLDRFIGFISGLDIGERVELEGYAPPTPGSSQERFFQVTKLRLDEMDYELTPLPNGVQVTTPQPRKDPVQPSAKEAKDGERSQASQWLPKNGLGWMQALDLNAIWKDDIKSKRNKNPDDYPGPGANGFFD
jgi:hypothetical protein